MYFEQDWRYALLSLSMYLGLGLIVNVTLFQASPVALWWLLDVIMIVLPIGAFVARSRKAYAGITLIYVPINVIDMLISLAN
ncbi:hypothetical protein QZR14_19630 [Pseudomonas sp. rhizo66]|uniref:hypothetical protein n=1 Tax=Pseudomonas sp. rhizo66 TaxID=3059674 RepID=UPI00288E908F|nr:hypothetical protein [Pseudomonas sp. rhizo66]MDT3313577.1 hypothetical protein [Pseudomonas sp. rhizo66]